MILSYYQKYASKLNKNTQKILSDILSQERYVERPSPGDPVYSWLTKEILIMSQGVVDCPYWRGVPLYKTVYDISLFNMMIWDIQPNTIFEIGRGAGGSALWMADLCKMFGINCHVYSMDIDPPTGINYDNIIFLKGDSNEIEKAFDNLSIYIHPWMIVEDAHVNVTGVLDWFVKDMENGDYLIAEDVRGGKYKELMEWEAPECIKIDRHYMDYFGPNATANLIFTQRDISE